MTDRPSSVTFGLTIMSRSIPPSVMTFLSAREWIMIHDTIPIRGSKPLRFIHRLFVLKILNLRTRNLSRASLTLSPRTLLTRLEAVHVLGRNLSNLEQTHRTMVLNESAALSSKIRFR